MVPELIDKSDSFFHTRYPIAAKQSNAFHYEHTYFFLIESEVARMMRTPMKMPANNKKQPAIALDGDEVVRDFFRFWRCDRTASITRLTPEPGPHSGNGG